MIGICEEIWRDMARAGGLAEGARQKLETGKAVNWISGDLRHALYAAMHAWLLAHGYNTCLQKGYKAMEDRFFQVAAEPVRSMMYECLLLAGGLELWLHGHGDIIPGLPLEEWKKKAGRALERTENLLIHLEKDIESRRPRALPEQSKDKHGQGAGPER